MKLNYNKVYGEIIKYYPIGIKSSMPEYAQYSGISSLIELCNNKLEPLAYKKWKELLKSIKNEVMRVGTESPLFDPSYSGVLLLSKQKMGIATYLREIHIHLSVLAPFYTLYGLDRVVLNPMKGEYVIFDPIIYISPYDFYQPWFDLLRKKIEGTYANYEFVPYSLLGIRVPSLSVSGAKLLDGQDPSVFQAFFTSEDITNYKFKGDFFYE